MSAAYRSAEGGLLERFEEVTKLLHAKLFDELTTSLDPKKDSLFSCQSDEAAESIYRRIAQLYKRSIDSKNPLFANGRGSLSGQPASALAGMFKY